MLTPRKKERIKSEEEYRAKIQSTLSENSAKNRIWTFLNSAIFLWILTTIVVGLLSWGYTQLQEMRQNAEEIHKLDIEVDARLGAVEYSIISHSASDKTP